MKVFNYVFYIINWSRSLRASSSVAPLFMSSHGIPLSKRMYKRQSRKKKLDKILRISCVVYILYRAIVHHKSITHRSNSWLTHIHMTCIYNSVWYSILDDSKCMDRVVHLFNSKRFSFIATVRTFQKIGFSNKRVEHFYYNACMHVC